MASGHVNRIKRPNTWLHRPMLQNAKKALANPEPSTHGTKRTWQRSSEMSAYRVQSRLGPEAPKCPSLTDPKPTLAGSKFAVQQPLLTHCDVLSFGSSTEGAAAPRLDSGQFRPPQGPVGRLMASRT